LDAAKTALIASTAPTGQTLFPHATVWAAAGHFWPRRRAKRSEAFSARRAFMGQSRLGMGELRAAGDV
jgi:hypothetical protein